MNRAMILLLALAVAGPLACSSSGNVNGPTVGLSQPTQAAPGNTNEPAFNSDTPPLNSDQPNLNPDQPNLNPDQPGAVSSNGQTANPCPDTCGNIDARCGEECGNLCIRCLGGQSATCSEAVGDLARCLRNLTQNENPPAGPGVPSVLDGGR